MQICNGKKLQTDSVQDCIKLSTFESLQTKACCKNESSATKGIKKMLKDVQETLQNQELKIETLTKKVNSLQKTGKCILNDCRKIFNNGLNGHIYIHTHIYQI